MASGESSPMTTPPPGPAYTPESIQRMQQVNVNICKHKKQRQYNLLQFQNQVNDMLFVSSDLIFMHIPLCQNTDNL